ncbi:ABC transporter [Bradyrhizobium sp. CCBAU 21359]|uniref:ABC transporter substrate-binding protein n=1 Tax=Bradyrhizobium sp. CCBAU 21359 TaxID=1325080 RepID=UPI0023053E3B|nr:peptide ABC transporter substrate-binding protein [Bradyrhizobium sp. CCBAU 21359]MDA9453948.1 ABC transporter [Bradyrhizobium sp. CCBAU 21359]
MSCSAIRRSYSRRSMMKAMVLGAAAPWVVKSSAFASSCGDQIVRIGTVRAPNTMNPFATWSSFRPTTFTYDFLVGVDAQRFGDRRGFAKEWSVADDKLTWTFKIWPGLKWSDGRPATARDAAFTYIYLRQSMGTPNELKVGWNNTAGLENVESIAAIDDETLQIVTKSPTRWPVDNTILIVPEHIWKDISYADARSTFRNSPPLVGTGPMIVAEFQPSQFTRLVPNEHFRGGRPAIAGVIENYFNTNDAVAQGLKSGSLDFGNGITAAQYEVLAKNSDIEVGQVPTEQINFLAFNTASGEGAGSTKALQDPAFRDAIGYAIDQKVIVDRAFRGHADPGVGLVMPAAVAYYSDLSDITRRFDLKEAARRLDTAGDQATDGDGVRKDKEGKRFQLELITGTVSGTLEMPVAVVQLIAGWLGKLGIPVSVTQLESGALQSRKASVTRGGGKWDLLVAGSWLSPSPRDLLVLGKSDAVLNNASYWKNKEFDRLASQVDVTVDNKQGRELVDQAVRLIYKEAPYIVLCYPVSLYAHRKDCFQGWGPEKEFSLWSYFPFDRLKPV